MDISKEYILANIEINEVTKCWKWKFIKPNAKHAYVHVFHNGKGIMLHRHAYTLWHGPIPTGLFVCHKCDNSKCCNPDHLFVGTATDNVRDMVSKGRNVNTFRKLSHDDVRAIRIDPRSCRKIGRDYGVDNSAICRIKSGEHYAFVK